jgi:hypothetical protein
MITREQAIKLTHGQELHFGVCKSTTGPRGGVKVTQTRVRVSGQCQTWKTRPEDFRVPVKHGMYDNGEIVPSNAAQFHLTSDCPLEVQS